MSELRWILIGFGLVLLAAIYLWGRRSREPSTAPEAPNARARPEPQMSAQSSRHVEDPGDIADPVRYQAPLENLADTADLEDDEDAEPARPAPASTVRRTTPGDDTADARPASLSPETWRSRLEPTLGDTPTEELPIQPQAYVSEPAAAPGDAPRRIERRKILSLRLSLLPQKVGGDRLLECLLAESLEHGRYNVFHRQHGDAAVFSVASMVEPGTFDLDKMQEIQYPGITLFAQLPGPVPGMHALNELVACARSLQQGLGGTLQDERGVPLTVHRIERMRQEVREFERPAAGRSGSGPQPAHP